MRYKVSDLIVEFVGDNEALTSHCSDYEYCGDDSSDICVDLLRYQKLPYPEIFDDDLKVYLDTGFQFYRELVRFNGMMLHASAVEYEGKAYLFSGPCGTGKSTHTGLWTSTFGDGVKLFNDDKPALRRVDDCWYAYGTPWSGKNHINVNVKVPLAGICFLKQAPENKIRRLNGKEALENIVAQTMKRRLSLEQMDFLLTNLDKLIREIPIFELENRPEPAAAHLSYETMRKAAEEAGL